MEFQEVLNIVYNWYCNVKNMYVELKYEIIIQNEHVLRISIENNKYMSEICVSEDPNRPYKYVNFEIYDLELCELPPYEPIYYYNDSYNISKENIIKGLNQGISIIVNKSS